MHRTNKKKYAAAGAGLASLVGLVATSLPSNAAPVSTEDPITGTTSTRANLQPLNNSGVEGHSEVVVDGKTLQVSVNARGLLKEMPHAQHIHFGSKARNECPTVRDDDNHDHRLTTAEGQPAYGPVKVSLTTRGDTSADSTLAVNRFPTAENRRISYEREITTTDRVSRAISNGKGVVVIHGIDYNGNGKYDFQAGKSELDPALPAEATDTVACGVLKEIEDTPASATP